MAAATASTRKLPRPNIGIFSDEEAALAGVVARLVEALDPQAIWLFGSRARGNHRPDSDFDLLVVAKENGRFRSNDYVQVLRPTFDTGVDCEVVPCSLEDFADAVTTHTTFVSQIIAHGRLVFEAQPTPSLRRAKRRSNPDSGRDSGREASASAERLMDCFASLAMTDRPSNPAVQTAHPK